MTEGFKRGDRGEPGEEGEKVGSSVNRWRCKSEMRRDMKSEREEEGGGGGRGEAGVRGVSWHRRFLIGENVRVPEQKGARKSRTKSRLKIWEKRQSRPWDWWRWRWWWWGGISGVDLYSTSSRFHQQVLSQSPR